MPPAIGSLVSVTIFTIMFSLGMGLSGDPIRLLRDRPAFLWRVMLATCLLVPLLGLGLIALPFASQISTPARFAIALMVACPSAPLTLFRVSRSRGIPELAVRLQIAAALLAIVTIPMVAALFIRIQQVSDWTITSQEVALQVVRVQLIPLAAGIFFRIWRPSWARRWQASLDRLATGLLLVMVVALLVVTSGQLIPFLTGNLPGLLSMVCLVAICLVMGHGLAGRDPLERRTVALVTGMRNAGLAMQLAVTYAPGMKGLIPALISYVLITMILSTVYLKWQARRLSPAAP